MNWICENCGEEKNPESENYCMECGFPRYHVVSSGDGSVTITDKNIKNEEVEIIEDNDVEIVEEELEKKTEDINNNIVPKLKLHLYKNGAITTEILEIFGNVEIGKFSPEKGPVDIDIESLSIPGVKYISRKHATISFSLNGNEVFIEDTESLNGTWINEIKIESNKKIKIKNGDIISFANTKFQVEF